MVKSKAETPRLYIVETPQGEYRRISIHTATTTSATPKFQVKNVPQHTWDVQTVPIADSNA